MQIIVSHIPPEGLQVNLSKDGEWFRRQLSKDMIDQFSVTKIDFHGVAERVAKNVSIKGKILIDAIAQCSRCLESYPLTLADEGAYVIIPAPEAPSEEEIELGKDDLDILYYKDDSIDLEPIIVEQILLQLPIKPLCDEGCMGLCSVCGANLNKESCSHTIQQIESPFAALKNLKVKRKRS